MAAQRSERSIGRALSIATLELRDAGIETARLDAELLLGYLTGKNRTRLAVDNDHELTDIQLAELQQLVVRRIDGTSIAYLIGMREFMGHEFAVGPGVLVPRPETELMVERAVSSIPRLWDTEHIRVLDLCTGSGAIALSLALLTDNALVSITGSDVSADALTFARKNRETFGLDGRVDLVEGDLLSWTDGPWDMILTNPPYLTPEQVDGNPDLATEPRLALDGGAGGLELITRILDQATSRVARRFAMMIEIDPDQADAVRLFSIDHFATADVIIVPDLSGRARFVSIERQECPS